MPLNEWKGGAPQLADIYTVTVLEAVPGAVYSVTWGNGLTATYTATDADTPATIAAALAAQLSAVDDTDATVSVSAAVITISSALGEPLGAGSGPTSPAVPASRVVRLQSGRLAVGQLVEVTLPANTSGGTWTISADFGSGTETTGNLAWNIAPSALQTALIALATPNSGDIICTIVSTSPRKYRIELADDLKGITTTFSASGANLTGSASITVQTIQHPGSDVRELQAIFLPALSTNDSHFVRFRAGSGTWSAWSARAVSAIESDANVLTEIQTLVDSVYGAGVCTVTKASAEDSGDYGDSQIYIGLFLTFANYETHALVACEYKYPGGTITYPTTAKRLQTGNGPSKNEFQVVAATGNYTLTHDGNTTATIAVPTDSPQTRLEALASISAGDVIIHTGSPYLYVVEFDQNLGNSNEPALTPAGSATVATVLNGGTLRNEIHAVTIIATGGTWTWTDPDGPTTTNAITFPLTLSAVLTELVTLYGSGNVAVSGAGTEASPLLVEHIGANAGTDITTPTVNGDNLTGGPDPTFSTVRAAVEGLNELQQLLIDPNATAGNYALGHAGEFSAPITHNETAANIDTAFGAVSTVGGASHVDVTGEFPSYVVEFTGDNANQPHDLIQIDQSGLTVSESTALQVEQTQAASGPNHWNVAANWTRDRVPDTGDTAVLGSGNLSIYHGLRQRRTFTVSGSSTRLTLDGHAHFVDDQIVRLRTADTFPTLTSGSLSASTDYYIVSRGVDDNGNTTLQIATTSGGTPIEFSDAGTGPHTVEVQLAAIRQFSLYSGTVGLPRRNSSGDWEERPRFLEIGLLSATETNCEIGLGTEGAGSDRLHFDFDESPLKARVLNTGAGSEAPALQILINNGTNAEIDQIGGELGIATENDQAATLKTLRRYAGRMIAGNVLVKSAVIDYANGIEFFRVEHTADGIQFRTASNV